MEEEGEDLIVLHRMQDTTGFFGPCPGAPGWTLAQRVEVHAWLEENGMNANNIPLSRPIVVYLIDAPMIVWYEYVRDPETSLILVERCDRSHEWSEAGLDCTCTAKMTKRHKLMRTPMPECVDELAKENK